MRGLGLDLGGSSVKWVVVEHGADPPSVAARGQVATPRLAGPTAIVSRLAGLAAEVAQEHGRPATVGVGVPGLYDAASGSTRFIPNIPGDWSRTPVSGPVGAAVGAPVGLINDARACTLAELRLGAGRGARSLVCIALGTGVGGGIAIDGRVYLGHEGTAGEFGHQTIDPEGPLCTCGNRGCLEVFCTAAANARACDAPDVATVVEAARAGDERARAVLERVGRILGVGAANAVVLLTPDRIVVGGGVGGAGELLLAPLREELLRRVHITDVARIEVRGAELGLWAGAIGAALHGVESAGLDGGPQLPDSPDALA